MIIGETPTYVHHSVMMNTKCSTLNTAMTGRLLDVHVLDENITNFSIINK